jgi:succinate-semialdehyde dehydrogenase/glutarate-semialdehyde dehydrogenase
MPLLDVRAARAAYPALSLLIDGVRVAGGGRATRDVFDPSDASVLGRVPEATTEDVARAVEAAARGFERWRRVSALERGRVLLTAAARIRARRDEIARLITLELGKPYGEAQREVDTAAEMFEWSGEEARRLYGRLIPARSAGMRQMVTLEPLGPVAAFSGWNAPAITPARKISGALAAGCSVVIKPSEETPAVALAIADAVQDSGLPDGVLNVLFGDPGLISTALLAAPQVRMVTFTGSTEVGRQLGERAARTMKRATLELGGHAPVLVFADADPEAVASAAVAAKYRNAGQVCTSPTRFLVHESIVARFRARFVEATRALKVGGGFDTGVQMGPLANPRRLDAMQEFVDDARSRGMSVDTGGCRLPGAGWFWAPTVLGDAHDDCRAANVEPFGPLALIRPFGHFDEAIAQANRLPFGLAAYAFTRDLNTARAASEAIDSGVVSVNDWTASLAETPFGGTRDSGLGAEGGIEGVQAFMRVKCVREG